MIEYTLNNEIAKITSALIEKPESTISGALLGELLPVVAPDLNIREVMEIPSGPGALRKFVDRHLKHVLTPNHKQGSDIIYSILREELENPIQADAEIWHTFVRTNSPKKLFFSGNTLKSKSVEEENFDSEKAILSATNDELNQIRIDFINSLGEIAAALPEMKAPYTEWSVALKKLGRQHYRNWTEYRLRKIEDLFEQRIDSLGIEKKSRSEILSQLKRSQLAAKDLIGTKKTQPNSVKTTIEEENNKNYNSNSNSNSNDEQFRSAIIEVIKKLPILELRDLKLPAGEVADAMVRQHMK